MPDVRYGTRQARWVLFATIFGSALASLDSTIVNVALPAIGKDLHSDVAGLQWVLSAYLLTLASLILVGGSLGDRFGRKRVFLIGVVWFTVASLLCGLAPTVGALAAARAVQGIGAALLMPGSLAMIEAVFVPSDRAKAIGAWAGLGGVALAIGPLFGGWLVAAATWRLVFLINVPLAALVLFAARHVPETNDPSAAVETDVAGAVAAALGLAGVTYGLIESSHSTAKIAGALGVAFLVAFVVIEQRSNHPMMSLALFRNATFSALNALTFVVYAALSGASFLISVDLQQVLGYSPIEAGAALIPMTLLLLAFSSRSGAFASRHGPRMQLTLGPFVIAIALAAMARIHPGTHYLTGILPQVMVFAIGLVLMVAPLTASVLAAVEDAHAGIASGVNNAVARLGGLIAIATLPTLAGIHRSDYVHPAAFNAEFHRAMWIAAGLAAFGGVVALVALPRRAPRRSARAG